MLAFLREVVLPTSEDRGLSAGSSHRLILFLPPLTATDITMQLSTFIFNSSPLPGSHQTRQPQPLMSHSRFLQNVRATYWHIPAFLHFVYKYSLLAESPLNPLSQVLPCVNHVCLLRWLRLGESSLKLRTRFSSSCSTSSKSKKARFLLKDQAQSIRSVCKSHYAQQRWYCRTGKRACTCCEQHGSVPPLA